MTVTILLTDDSGVTFGQVVQPLTNLVLRLKTATDTNLGRIGSIECNKTGKSNMTWLTGSC